MKVPLPLRKRQKRQGEAPKEAVRGAKRDRVRFHQRRQEVWKEAAGGAVEAAPFEQ